MQAEAFIAPVDKLPLQRRPAGRLILKDGFQGNL